jgi:uncharacterized protein YaeQ
LYTNTAPYLVSLNPSANDGNKDLMALTATIYPFTIDLSDVDRSVYETLELRLARQPAETVEYMLMRLLAYCLEYADGISFTQGIAAGDEPAVWVHDLTGKVRAWIEVGLPDAERLHRGSRAAERVAVYTHRDVEQFQKQLAGKRIFRSEAIPVYALDRRFLEQLATLLERRSHLTITVTEGQLYLTVGGQTLNTPVVEHRIRPDA